MFGVNAIDYESLRLPASPSPKHASQHAIVGAGPVGLVAAIDVAQNGVDFVHLDDDGRLSNGSRAICFAKRTLEIVDRLRGGDAMISKGVGWSWAGCLIVFHRDSEVCAVDLLPETGHGRPPPH